MNTAANPRDALASVARSLDRLDVPWFVTGSLATSMHGLPRSTNDIDVVALLPPSAAEAFASDLATDYYADAGMIRTAFLRRQPCNVIHLPTMMKIDLMPPRMPFDGEAMQRRQRDDLPGDDGGPGLPNAVDFAT